MKRHWICGARPADLADVEELAVNADAPPAADEQGQEAVGIGGGAPDAVAGAEQVEPAAVDGAEHQHQE